MSSMWYRQGSCRWKFRLEDTLFHPQALWPTVRRLVEAREEATELEVQVQVMWICRNINHIISILASFPLIAYLSNSWQQKLRPGRVQCKTPYTMNKTRRWSSLYLPHWESGLLHSLVQMVFSKVWEEVLKIIRIYTSEANSSRYIN